MSLDSNDVLTEAAAAKLVLKSERWLREQRRAGSGPKHRFAGKTPLYKKSAVFEWLEQQRGSEGETARVNEPEDLDALAATLVAQWPVLSADRKAELGRLLAPAAASLSPCKDPPATRESTGSP